MDSFATDWHPWLAQLAWVPLVWSSVFCFLVWCLPDGRLRQEWGALARWGLWLGTGFLVAATVSGFLLSMHGEARGLTRVDLVSHRYWAYASLTIYLIVFAWSLWGYRRYLRADREPGLSFLLAALLAAAALLMAVGRGTQLAHPADGDSAAPSVAAAPGAAACRHGRGAS